LNSDTSINHRLSGYFRSGSFQVNAFRGASFPAEVVTLHSPELSSYRGTLFFSNIKFNVLQECWFVA